MTIDLDDRTGRLPSDMFKAEFAKIFLSMMDVSVGHNQAKIEMTRALLAQGVQLNMQDMFSLTDLLLDRLQRISIVKSMAPLLGLTGEMEEIIRREMDLIYASRKQVVTKTHGVINGDAGDKNDY